MISAQALTWFLIRDVAVSPIEIAATMGYHAEFKVMTTQSTVALVATILVIACTLVATKAAKSLD